MVKIGILRTLLLGSVLALSQPLYVDAAQTPIRINSARFADALCHFFKKFNQQLDEVSKCRNALQATIELRKLKNIDLEFEGTGLVIFAAGTCEVACNNFNKRIQAEVLNKLGLLSLNDRCEVLRGIRNAIVKFGKHLFTQFDGAYYAKNVFAANRPAANKAVVNYNALLSTIDQALAPLVAQQAPSIRPAVSVQAPSVIKSSSSQTAPQPVAPKQPVQPVIAPKIPVTQPAQQKAPVVTPQSQKQQIPNVMPKPVVTPQQPKAPAPQPIVQKQQPTQPVITPKVPVVAPQQTKPVVTTPKPQVQQTVAPKVEQTKQTTPVTTPVLKPQQQQPAQQSTAIDLQALKASLQQITALLAAKQVKAQGPVVTPQAQIKTHATEVKPVQKPVQKPVDLQTIAKPQAQNPAVQTTPKATKTADVKPAVPQEPSSQLEAKQPVAKNPPAPAKQAAFEQKPVLPVVPPIKTEGEPKPVQQPVQPVVAQKAPQTDKAPAQQDAEPRFDVKIKHNLHVTTPAECKHEFTLTPENRATLALLEKAHQTVVDQEAYEKAHPCKQEVKQHPDLTLAPQQEAEHIEAFEIPNAPHKQLKSDVKTLEQIRSEALKNILATYQHESASLPIVAQKNPDVFVEKFLAPKGSDFNPHLCLLLTPGRYADQNITSELNGSLAHNLLNLISKDGRKNLQQTLNKFEFDHKKYDQLSATLYAKAVKNERGAELLVRINDMLQHAPREGWKKFIEKIQRPYDMILSLPQPPAHVTINNLGDYVTWYLQDFAPDAAWRKIVQPQLNFLCDLLYAEGHEKTAQLSIDYVQKYIEPSLIEELGVL